LTHNASNILVENGLPMRQFLQW